MAALQEPGDSAVAVAWHEEAKASAEMQQRVRAEVAAAVGQTVDEVGPDPTEIARQIVSQQVPRALIDEVRGLDAALSDADAQLREGNLEEARRVLGVVRSTLEDQPILPTAAVIARRAALLEARTHWSAGEEAMVEGSLRAALALDPHAQLSTRDAPPALARKYEQLRAEIIAATQDWPTARAQLSDGTRVPSFQLEVDARPGARAVPPGRHFLVVRRPGHAPAGAFVEVDEVWTVPSDQPTIGEGIPDQRAEAERTCEALELSKLVLAHQRDDRVGLEAYRCGGGYSRRWVGSMDDVAEGVAAVLGDTEHEGDATALDEQWPSVIEPKPTDPPPPPEKKPWYRRAWVWVLIGGVVAGGVTAGVVLGTQGGGDGIGVNADDFLRP
jgi:hypothetical protein